jgi:hypothetical protein
VRSVFIGRSGSFIAYTVPIKYKQPPRTPAYTRTNISAPTRIYERERIAPLPSVTNLSIDPRDYVDHGAHLGAVGYLQVGQDRGLDC